MPLRTEWKAISDQIQGLLEAGRFYLQTLSTRNEDTYAIADRELMPHTQQIFESLEKFYNKCQTILPPTAASCLKGFLDRSRRWYVPSNGLEGLPSIATH